MTKTEWFPPEVNPARAGAYEIEKMSGIAWYRWFDGTTWTNSYWSAPELAYKCRETNWRDCDLQVTAWRGLTEPAA